MMKMIFKGEMEPIIAQGAGWDVIEAKIKAYCAPAEEMLLRAKTVDFFNKQDWTAFVPTAKHYLEKYEKVPGKERSIFQSAIEQHTKN